MTDDQKDSGFVRTVLTGLFETLAEMDERDQSRRSKSASAQSGDTRFDYGLSVGIGPQAETTTTDERSPAADTDHATTVNPTEAGCTVTVDLPDVDPRELSAGVDGERLVVADDEGVIERVSLPHEGLAVEDASFNNGVLDVRLRGERR
ncbi:gas vesicle protein GvpH [Halococcus sediminicola]|uniref:gas vesicle protein GvpH n=1 Tax=Halococcus sediminicola TaxID=1264579 RepID=UPI0006785142|nr:gas vesicle protein GvpH [Halococcus sediminicola]